MKLIVLSVGLLASVILCVSGKYLARPNLVYVFKPLSTILVISVAVIYRPNQSPAYWYLIVAGLFCSLVGDVFLMLPTEKFVNGLVSFLIAHVFFALAFLSIYRGSSERLAFVALLVGVVVYRTLLPGLGTLRYPVLGYLAVVLIMAWRASEAGVHAMSSMTLMAVIGSLLFVVSDTVLAVDRFRHPFRTSQLVILPTYFAAIYLLALSATTI